MPRADRKRPRRSGLGGHHPEGLGKGARNHQCLARREQVDELGVLQAPGEHDAGRESRGGRQVRGAPIGVGLERVEEGQE